MSESDPKRTYSIKPLFGQLRAALSRFAAGQRRSSLRRKDFNPMNFHLLADALQVLVVARRRVSFDDVTDTGRLHYRFCQANFVDAGETLHACSDIHVLSEVVDPIVEPYGNGPASVHTD